MTFDVLEVPHIEELAEYPVEVQVSDQVGVVTLIARANDNDELALTWDITVRSVAILWKDQDGVNRLRIERESITKVSLRTTDQGLEIRVWFASSDVGGQMLVQVNEDVRFSDTILYR